MNKKMKLGSQIIIIMFIAVLIPTLAISGINFYREKGTVENTFSVSTADNVNRVSEVIKGIAKSNIESIDMLSKDPNALAILNNPDSEQWLKKSFQSFLDTHKDVVSAYYGVKDGKMMLMPEQKLPDGYDPRQRDWYKEAVDKKGQAIITAPYEDAAEKGKYIVTFAKAVPDEKSGDIIGVVAIDVKLSTLSESIASMKIGQDGYVALLDPSGKVIAHKNKDLLNKDSKSETWIDSVISNKEGKGKVAIGNQNMIYSVMQDKATEWKIVGLVPEKELLDQVAHSRNLSLMIGLISLALAALTGYIFSNSIVKPLKKIVVVLDRIKQGDFTVKVAEDKKMSHELAVITEATNGMINDIVNMMQSVTATSSKIRESSQSLAAITEESNAIGDEVSRAVQEIANGATNQASSLEDSAEAVGMLGEEVNKAMDDSKDMVKASFEVKEHTENGMKLVQNLTTTFEQTSQANLELAKEVEILSQNSNKISSITDTITEITEQTNLLALNASIEAARAGEAGRGFAVVADEVRKLAEQSSVSASEINTVIIEIKNSIAAVLQRIEMNKSLNAKTVESMDVTSSSFESIENAIKTLEVNINKVNGALEQINLNKNTVVGKIDEIATVSQETAASTEEVSASSEEQLAGLHEVTASAEALSNLAEELDTLVSKFKI
ncbi:methyl-accepting chemotaxis protein [Clostridium omnivorum]|uniref:Methyl-accepting chemotaxis protein n=1 Tax=Clostridium omnivorum TaxID=1604902 RepID=A0ABQ5N6N1_9CLOT|nr:methyl-accepting chemotaxis protein [Clostridium sp. E14]GLC30786.1 methyl-accepting chemotaxis protein [Clostridium sp. E14]